jgi:hypothetical protein
MTGRNMTNYDMDEIERKRDSVQARSDWVERQGDYNPDMVRLEPKEHFDWCIRGVVSRANLHVLCYDVADIIIMLQDKMGMTEDDAIEHYYYNIEGSYMGEHSPVFLNKVFPESLYE